MRLSTPQSSMSRRHSPMRPRTRNRRLFLPRPFTKSRRLFLRRPFIRSRRLFLRRPHIKNRRLFPWSRRIRFNQPSRLNRLNRNSRRRLMRH